MQAARDECLHRTLAIIGTRHDTEWGVGEENFTQHIESTPLGGAECC